MHSVNPPVPVISVGNLTYGGTNKTPFTIMLADYACSKGINTAIVTRGYKGKSHSVKIIANGKGQRDIIGDEALMISQKLPRIPVAVSKRRVDGINALYSMGAQLVIADDAFQHKSMNRQCDIVLVDALCPFGNGSLIPSGILREKISALKRAHIVVITKASMSEKGKLLTLFDTVRKYVPPENIFMSDIAADGWIFHTPERGADVFAFSATGSPETFTRTLSENGCNVTGNIFFRDHHKYTRSDVNMINTMAEKSGASYVSCTEKDLANMTDVNRADFSLPLIVPKIRVTVRDFPKFSAKLVQIMRPKIVVSSNGYGEDAIASILAGKIISQYPLAKVSAFPLVGNGQAFRRAGVGIISAKSVTPSAGILKYSMRELWSDIKAGLLRQVSEQLRDWRNISRDILPVICVGDVYLLLNTFLGTGKKPLFVATAKTVYISGHWRTERALIRGLTLKTWTRDEPTALQIGANATYSGNPIMDLLSDVKISHGDTILLLPGSRKSALHDVKILLGAAEILAENGHDDFRMVLAPTLDYGKFFASCEAEGWRNVSGFLTKNSVRIALTDENIAKAADGALILLGMGGTANQLCAGLGVPVIAPDNRGKRVQKKLLRHCEILTSPSPNAMAQCALHVLADRELYRFMSDTGRKMMGCTGACDDVVKYTREVLRWDIFHEVFARLNG